MSFTRDHYPQLLDYRTEGLRKVGALFVDQLDAPKARIVFPEVWPANRNATYPGMTIGPVRVVPIGASMIIADELFARFQKVKILDIGCAAGRFRDYLLTKNAKRAIEYVGMDVAPPAVDFPVFSDIAAVQDTDFDLIFMSEVAEHMSADDFAEKYLRRFPMLLKADGMAIVGVPNPLTPTVLQRDVTHVQHYPWFDLYAMLRFFFEEVDVTRTHFIHTPKRLFNYPLRRVLSYVLEVDWCEGLTLVGRRPRVESSESSSPLNGHNR